MRLWALDAVAPGLAAATVGSGPGGKFELLNRLLATRPVPSTSWVVFLDDDLVAPRVTISEFVAGAERASLDLAQPGHAWFSSRSHDVTRSRPGLRARRTGYVEIGPVFAVSPRWRDRVVPFRDDVGMGWELQLDFFLPARDGCVLGVVDECRIAHLGVPGALYDGDAEMQRMRERADDLGVAWDDFSDSFRTLGRWYRWRREPPWA